MSGRGPRWITKPTVIVQLLGTFHTNRAYATIGETKYTEETTLQVRRRQSVSVTVDAGSYAKDKCVITLNGATVQSGNGTYAFELTSDTTISFEGYNTGNSMSAYYTCEITTK